MRTPQLNWDIQSLDVEDFFPIGVTIIEGNVLYPELLHGFDMTFAPGKSATLQSPDLTAFLSMGLATRNTGGTWLVLKETGTGASEPIHVTGKSIQALWSPKGDKLAVNFWSDSYSRDFFVLVRGSPERTFVDLSPIVARYFPVSGVVRGVAKVYRWTKNGDLLVRSLTQKMEEPYPVFGCELLVSVSGSSPSLSMLRGFLKE